MKHWRDSQLAVLTALLLAAVTMTGCGQTGPLTLPTETAAEPDDGGDEDETENER